MVITLPIETNQRVQIGLPLLRVSGEEAGTQP